MSPCENAPGVLALDEPRWSELDHAYGAAGNIPALLRALERGEQSAWDEIFSALCHQGTVYTASYAAVPHLVRIGATAPWPDQIMFWSFVGGVAVSQDAAPVPDDLREAYLQALVQAEELTLVCIGPGLDDATGLTLLIALAGIRRLPAIEEALHWLKDEEIVVTCPRCHSNLLVSTADVPFFVEESDLVLALGTSAEMKAPPAPHPELRQLARLARSAGLVDLEHRIDALARGARCPTCQLEISLVPA
jgi:hypothetical protein